MHGQQHPQKNLETPAIVSDARLINARIHSISLVVCSLVKLCDRALFEPAGSCFGMNRLSYEQGQHYPYRRQHRCQHDYFPVSVQEVVGSTYW